MKKLKKAAMYANNLHTFSWPLMLLNLDLANPAQLVSAILFLLIMLLLFGSKTADDSEE